MVFSVEEAKALHAEGWVFHKKSRKGKWYISARKGDKEKGLGPFSEDNWSIIMRIIHDLPVDERSLIQTKDPFKETLIELKAIINSAYMKCENHGPDGFCNYWHLDELPTQAVNLNDKERDLLFKKASKVGSRWLFQAYPFMCNNCPAFKMREG
jgi:hypothetical protein